MSMMLAAQMCALLQPQLPTGSAIRRAVRAGTVTSCENSSFDLEQCICSALSEDDVAACHRLADEAFEAVPSSLTECETPCESPLVIALQVARKAGALLQTQDESAATTLLQAELPTDGNWQWNLDCRGGGIVAIVRLDKCDDVDEIGEAPAAAFSVLWRRGELISATRGGGAFSVPSLDEDGHEAPKPLHAGGASSRHQVLHIPAASAWAYEETGSALVETFELKMPLQVIRPRGDDEEKTADEGDDDDVWWWDGLLDVALGRVDVAIIPPRRLLSSTTTSLGSPEPPAAVLLALDLTLWESGGVLSDVLGNELDLHSLEGTLGSEAVDTAAKRGLLACEAASHNFVLANIRFCFDQHDDGGMLISLGGLREKLKGFGDGGGFSVEYE